MSYSKVTFFALMVIPALIAGCDPDGRQTAIATAESECSANEVVVALLDGGVSASVTTAKRSRASVWEIRVAACDESNARRILVERDLPRTPALTRAEAYSQPSMMPTRAEEQGRQIAAMQGEIERFLETYDRVVRARVIVGMSEPDPLKRDAQPRVSAAVVIKYLRRAADDAPSESWLSQATANTASAPVNDVPVSPELVRDLVARSVDGLSPDNVSVSYTIARGTITAPVEQTRSTSEPASAVVQTPSLRLLWLITGVAAVLGMAVVALLTVLARRGGARSVAARPA